MQFYEGQKVRWILRTPWGTTDEEAEVKEINAKGVYLRYNDAFPYDPKTGQCTGNGLIPGASSRIEPIEEP